MQYNLLRHLIQFAADNLPRVRYVEIVSFSKVEAKAISPSRSPYAPSHSMAIFVGQCDVKKQES